MEEHCHSFSEFTFHCQSVSERIRSLTSGNHNDSLLRSLFLGASIIFAMKVSGFFASWDKGNSPDDICLLVSPLKIIMTWICRRAPVNAALNIHKLLNVFCLWNYEAMVNCTNGKSPSKVNALQCWSVNLTVPLSLSLSDDGGICKTELAYIPTDDDYTSDIYLSKKMERLLPVSNGRCKRCLSSR